MIHTTNRTAGVLALIAIALPGVSAAETRNWWRPTSSQLPELVAQGYQVVGYSALPEASRIMDIRSFRYVLQKEASVAYCVEKVPTMAVEAAMTACYLLVAPKADAPVPTSPPAPDSSPATPGT